MNRRTAISPLFRGSLRAMPVPPRRRGSRRFLALAVLLLACRGSAPEPRQRQWQQIDLWSLEPVVRWRGGERTGSSGGVGADSANDRFFRRLSYLGGGHDVVAGERASYLRAARVPCLVQAEDVELEFEITVGEAAYFSYRPLRNESFPRPFRWQVSVVDGGERLLLHEIEPRLGRLFAPPRQTVDLSRFAGRTIRLELTVEALDGRSTGAVGEDGALWASASVYHRPLLSVAGGSARPNVLLLTVDTLRADALGAYGAEPSLTPAIDALAAQSDLFETAVSSFNSTNPSFASMMTGLLGLQHGVYDLSTELAGSHRTLGEELRKAGYATGAIFSVRHLGKAEAGLRQGFDDIFEIDSQRSAEYAVDTALGWLQGREEPWFLWLHLFDPHTPHMPPRPFSVGMHSAGVQGLAPETVWKRHRDRGWPGWEEPRLGGTRQLYYEEVAYVDREVDRLLAFLEDRSDLEHTILVLTADHGENLGEHGILHRHAGLFETTTRVPLIIRWPGRPEGRRLGGLVQTIDLFPTLLAAAGLQAPASSGRDLRRERHRFAVSEAAEHTGTRLRTERWAYMVSRDNVFFPDGEYLFDLETDPEETRNLIGTGLPVEQRLRSAHQSIFRGDAVSGERRELDALDRRELEALGYL